MLSLVKPGDFFREVSRRPGLKFTLAWLSMGGVVLPAALLMSFGVSEKYVLPLVLVVTLPFQYSAFCISRWLKGRKREWALNPLPGKIMTRSPSGLVTAFEVVEDSILFDEPGFVQTPSMSERAQIVCGQVA